MDNISVSALITDNELTASERLVGLYCFFVADAITVRDIQTKLALSDKKVLQSLNNLVKRGYLVRARSHNGWEISSELEYDVDPENGRNFRNSGTFFPNSGKNFGNSGTFFRNSGTFFPEQEETESEKESKKESTKERSKEKEREKEEGVRDIGNPYGLPLSETIVSDVAYTREGDPLSDSELLPDTEYQKVKQCPYQAIQNMFNRICVSYRKIKGIDGKRRQLVSGRWTSYPDLEVFRQVFENAENSLFMKGQGQNGWTADFDWMMKPSNFQKVLEGNYNDRPQNAGGGNVPNGDPFAAYLDSVIREELSI